MADFSLVPSHLDLVRSNTTCPHFGLAERSSGQTRERAHDRCPAKNKQKLWTLPTTTMLFQHLSPDRTQRTAPRYVSSFADPRHCVFTRPRTVLHCLNNEFLHVTVVEFSHDGASLNPTPVGFSRTEHQHNLNKTVIECHHGRHWSHTMSSLFAFALPVQFQAHLTSVARAYYPPMAAVTCREIVRRRVCPGHVPKSLANRCHRVVHLSRLLQCQTR